jgi:cytochrome bd-type quinol oxidase subunit 1
MFGSPHPTEAKVKATTATAGVSSVAVTTLIVALLTMVWPHMSDENKVLLAGAASAVVVPVLTFAAGWLAKHTPRAPVPDAPAALPPPG